MFSGCYQCGWQEAVLSAVNAEEGLRERTLGGMNLRRFGYDHYGCDKLGPGYPLGWADGCKPYPLVKDRTPPPENATMRIYSSDEDIKRAAQVDSDMFAEYKFER